MKEAISTDWKTKPMPAKNTVFDLERSFDVHEMEAICQGFLPEQMEDKWFIYYENCKLYFHRSWTGYCIAIVTFVEEDGRGRMVQAEVNRDPEQYKVTSNRKDKELISYLVSVVLLRREADFPTDAESPEEKVIQQWSNVGRTGLGEFPDRRQ